ncbi:zinc finger, CCHC-type containing protein [Tanacetum coccineum]
MKIDGTIDKFKARLVIQGFRQKEGINYFDTYAPVARITTIRLLLALAAIHNLLIHQMDVKTAFLNGNLEEEVYMKQPEGFVMPCNEHKLYLVEGSRDQVGSQYSYCYSIEEDPRTYNEAMQSRDFAYWKEAIDDEFGSIMENNIWVLSYLHPGCKPLRCQMDLQRKMKSMEQCQTAIHNLGDPSNGLSKQHIKNGYLEEEVYMKHQKYLYYAAYSDASWINHVEDSSSTSGWVFLLGGGAILWASKKQTCITSSTMESEFVALVAAGKEAEWLRNLIHEIPIWPKPIALIYIHCDSAATLAKAYNQIYNGKSRHLGVRHSMIKELIMNGVISIEFVLSQHNLADHLTKGLARDLVIKSMIGMGLKSI